MTESQDLFDDSTMTFGEHLEVLRVHLVRSLFGLMICVIFWLYWGEVAIDVIRRPLDNSLRQYGKTVSTEEQAQYQTAFFDTMKRWFGYEDEEDGDGTDGDGKDGDGKDGDGGTGTGRTDDPPAEDEPAEPSTAIIEVSVPVAELARALHTMDPDRFEEPAEDESRVVPLKLESKAFADFDERLTIAASPRPVTLQVQEAFMTYVKVAIVTGLMTASPWIFYQLWLFVAAGLYPHEKKYVYTYLPLSLFLFFAGALLCYFAVLPLVLQFLFGFNQWMQVEPNIQLTKWINFAIVLPLMFGLSFQLPLVMLFLERISIFQEQAYREQRRMAILVIAILSMLLTPADPASMLMMMFPLIFLYEFGILLCKFSPAKTPFEGAEPV